MIEDMLKLTIDAVFPKDSLKRKRQSNLPAGTTVTGKLNQLSKISHAIGAGVAEENIAKEEEIETSQNHIAENQEGPTLEDELAELKKDRKA